MSQNYGKKTGQTLTNAADLILPDPPYNTCRQHKQVNTSHDCSSTEHMDASVGRFAQLLTDIQTLAKDCLPQEDLERDEK